MRDKSFIPKGLFYADNDPRLAFNDVQDVRKSIF